MEQNQAMGNFNCLYWFLISKCFQKQCSQGARYYESDMYHKWGTMSIYGFWVHSQGTEHISGGTHSHGTIFQWVTPHNTFFIGGIPPHGTYHHITSTHPSCQPPTCHVPYSLCHMLVYLFTNTYQVRDKVVFL